MKHQRCIIKQYKSSKFCIDWKMVFEKIPYKTNLYFHERRLWQKSKIWNNCAGSSSSKWTDLSSLSLKGQYYGRFEILSFNSWDVCCLRKQTDPKWQWWGRIAPVSAVSTHMHTKQSKSVAVSNVIYVCYSWPR